MEAGDLEIINCCHIMNYVTDCTSTVVSSLHPTDSSPQTTDLSSHPRGQVRIPRQTGKLHHQ